MSPAKTQTKTGQVDIFAKITGYSTGVVKGESFDSVHKGEIDVDSFVWSISQPFDLSSGLASGKRQYSAFTFAMRTQNASAMIMKMVMNGEHIKEMVITCRKAGKEQQEYLVYKFNECLISKVENGYQGTDQLVPADHVSVVFRKVQCTIKTQNPDGTLGGAFVAVDELGVH
jgi:type VI secretion system secreted protein Hcp